jgi:hypothetical protein
LIALSSVVAAKRRKLREQAGAEGERLKSRHSSLGYLTFKGNGTRFYNEPRFCAIPGASRPGLLHPSKVRLEVGKPLTVCAASGS